MPDVNVKIYSLFIYRLKFNLFRSELKLDRIHIALDDAH